MHIANSEYRPNNQSPWLPAWTYPLVITVSALYVSAVYRCYQSINVLIDNYDGSLKSIYAILVFLFVGLFALWFLTIVPLQFFWDFQYGRRQTAHLKSGRRLSSSV